MDLLRIEDLAFGIGDRTLLHDVDLRIAPGELTLCLPAPSDRPRSRAFRDTRICLGLRLDGAPIQEIDSRPSTFWSVTSTAGSPAARSRRRSSCLPGLPEVLAQRLRQVIAATAIDSM